MKNVSLLMVVLAQTTMAADGPKSLDRIQNIVIVYSENRSFDVLYGSFPGAHGLNQNNAASFTQLDRNDRVLPELPPIWDGLTAAGVTPPVTQEQTAHLPN